MQELSEKSFIMHFASDSIGRISDSYEGFLQQSEEQSVYGLHTHYGFNVKDRVAPSDFRAHQLALLDYLCVGLGDPLSEDIVRRALRLQLVKLSQGLSAIHPKTFERLVEDKAFNVGF